MGTSLQGKHEFIAKAIFDDYTDQALRIVENENGPPKSPAEQLSVKSIRVTMQATLFESLLDSLAVLQSGSEWKRSVANLRRTVLLEERRANNPWSGLVWVDVPALQSAPDALLFSLDTFLVNNSDKDRRDRFDGEKFVLLGESCQCALVESQVILRWLEYYEIIRPYITPVIAQELFPRLNRGDAIIALNGWIQNNIAEESTRKTALNCVGIWDKIHTQQKAALAAYIVSTREKFGFDPMSQGCGSGITRTQSQIRNNVLQKTAELQETDETALKTLRELLTDEQLLSYESDG